MMDNIVTTLLKDIALWLVKLLLPSIQSRVTRHGDRPLPVRFLEFGTLVFFAGIVLLGVLTGCRQSIIYSYLVLMPLFVLIGYMAIAFWEPDLFYGLVLKGWAKARKCKNQHVLCKVFHRLAFGGVDETMLEIIWESIPENIEKRSAEEGQSHRDKICEFVERYYKGMTEREKKFPLIIRAEDLDWDKLNEAHKVFAISLLSFSKFSIRPSEDEDAKIWVDVFLRGDQLAIYSNLGKRWIELLLDLAGGGKFRKGLVYLSNEVHSYLIGRREKLDLQRIYSDLPPRFSLRWASGGALLIVRYRKDPVDSLDSYWAALFFRDVFPIGWNVGNGASESLDEQFNLPRLCAREFCEEYVITGPIFEKSYLDHSLQEVYDSRVSPVQWYPFKRIEGNKIVEEISPKFMESHIDYREKVDGLVWSPRVKEGKFDPSDEHSMTRVRSVPTWTAVKVKNGQKQGIHLLFSVNPYELGVETIALFYATIKRYHQIIDGEFHLGRRVLIRRPVALINLGWLYGLFQERESLGDNVEDLSFGPELSDKLKGGRILPPVPPEQYKLFINDIPLRQRRLKILLEENSNRIRELTKIAEMLRFLYANPVLYMKNNLSKEEMDYAKEQITLYKRQLEDPTGIVHRWEDVYFEIMLSIDWLYEYAPLFVGALKRKLPLKDIRLRSLCPVTWKSLEYIFAHREVLKALQSNS